MSKKPPIRHAKNDNSGLRLVVDQPLGPEDVQRVITGITQRLEDEGASRAFIIDALFNAILDIAYRASVEQTEDSSGFLALERYNQLSHRSGELELLKAEIMARCCEQLTSPPSET
ncbi:MAG TPA: hypothetical protein EYG02_06215 [Henriciella marina]|uniref:hypothetical protein n=1 Tax=Henriciella sp. TaxID=1968823 RepID=UPI001835E898|nr:hypothetical protein [Henriciella sp.]HIG21772.1 hypothetical protein [Henriciella sp.]HIK64608.1 hypothetical protein [Henriciella marina]